MSVDGCGLCGSVGAKLVKSHIIPKALMVDGLASDEYLAIAGSKATRAPTISHAGVWSQIVCGRCEESFRDDDNFLIPALRELPNYPTAFGGEATAMVGVDPERLYRGILSVLYRAELSQHFMFDAVKLAVYREPIRQFLMQETLKAPAGVSIFLRHITNKNGQFLLNPGREKWEGVNAYRFYFPGLTAMIKVDQRPFPSYFSSLVLGATQWPLALRFDKLSPSERRAAYDIATRNGAHLSRVFGKFDGRHGRGRI
jgi:hypothetical protein